MHPVAGLDEFEERVDDRQPGADSGFVQQLAPVRVGSGLQVVVLLLGGGDGALVRQHDVHARCERGFERLGGIVRGDVHEHGIRQRMAGCERDRFRRRRLPTARQFREWRALRFRRAQRGEPPRREAARVEHHAATVDQAHHAQLHGVSLHLRDQRCEGPADLTEAEQHDVGPGGMARGSAADLRELERGVHGAQRGGRVLPVHHER